MHELDTIADSSIAAAARRTPDPAIVRSRARLRRRRRRVLASVTGLVVAVGVASLALALREPAALVDTASQSTEADATGGGAGSVLESLGEIPEPFNVVVFFRADATDSQIMNVQALLDSSDGVEASRFVTKQETYDEFRDHFAGDQEFLDTVTHENMPPSIRVVIDDIDDPFITLLEEADGVRAVIVSDGGPAASIDGEVTDGVDTTTTSTPTSTTTSTTLPPEANVVPLQKNLPSVSPAGLNRAGGRGVGIVDGTGEVVEIDLVSGAVVQTIATIPTEARFSGDPQLNWDGTAIYYFDIFEDSWFGCETSPGSIRRLDLLSGTSETVATGTDPKISPDGSKLAYLAASQCIPDPAAPDTFVLTPYDSVVVRDLAIGTERTWINESVASAISAAEGGGDTADLGEAQLSGLAWVDATTIAVGRERIDVESMTLVDEGGSSALESGSSGTTLGFSEELNGFVVAVRTEEGQVMVSVIRESGEWEQLYDNSFSTVAFDASLDNLAWIDGRNLHIEGWVVELPVDLIGFDW